MSDNLIGNSSMTEDEVAVKKQDTVKSRVYIKTADGYVQQVDFKAATLSGMVRKEMQSGLGWNMNNPISLPSMIKKNFLNFVINYCRYHHVSGSAYEGKIFAEILYNMNANHLYELAYVARYLQIELLIDRIYEAVVKKTESLSCFEELYHMFNRPNYVTEEEHLSWINLFRGFFTESKKENKGTKNSKKIETVSEARQHEDTRSIDELVAFIEGGDGDSSKKNNDLQTRKKKKKKNRKNKDSSKKVTDEITTQVSNASEATSHGVQGTSSSVMVADNSRPSNTRDRSVTAMDVIGSLSSEEFDRVVEDFARKLMLKGPVICFDSSSQEESGNHEFPSNETDP